MNPEAYPNQNHTIAHDECNRAFDSGSVFSANDEDIRRYLRALGTLNIPNDQVRDKAIIRSLVLNHLRMDRTIDELTATIKQLNEQNGIVAKRVFWLTWACVILGGAQLVCAIISALHGH